MAKRAGTRLRKAINFDIDTTSLRSLFGESGRSGAYSRIRVFLGLDADADIEPPDFAHD
jgi:hypothetical protein